MRALLERERLALEGLTSTLRHFVRNNETRLLRVALGTVFVWFGALKIVGETSVLGIIQSTYPFLASAPLIQGLGVGEAILGGGVLLGWRIRTFASLMALHLVGTLLVLFLAPAAVFDPTFPILTLQGEFVMKNLVLVSAALLLVERS